MEFSRRLLVQEEEVVDDVGILFLFGDLGIGAVLNQSLYCLVNSLAELSIAGTESNAVLLGAEVLVNDGQPLVTGDIAGRDRHIHKDRVGGVALQLGEALEEAVAGQNLTEGTGQLGQIAVEQGLAGGAQLHGHDLPGQI